VISVDEVAMIGEPAESEDGHHDHEHAHHLQHGSPTWLHKQKVPCIMERNAVQSGRK
jgi:hypothetical protein